jgi:hypothetical protein
LRTQESFSFPTRSAAVSNDDTQVESTSWLKKRFAGLQIVLWLIFVALILHLLK